MKKLLAIASGLAIAVGMVGCDEKSESAKSGEGAGGGMAPAPAMNAPGGPGGDPAGAPGGIDPGGMPGGIDPGGMPGGPGLADAGMPGAGLPDAGMPGAGMPEAGMPGADIPGGIGPGMPGVVDAGMPGAGMPDAGMPGAGVPGGIGVGMPGAVDPGMPGMPGMPGVPGIGVGDAGMPGVGDPGMPGMPGVPGIGVGEAGMPGVPGGAPGAGRPKTDYPAGSAEAAVVKLVLDLKAGKYKELAKVISARTSNPLLKSLRSGRPNASDISRANSYMGQVKPAGEGGARKLSSSEHQFTLVNQRGLLLTFVCRKESGKFMIYSLKTRASRSRRRR